jgi:hypothetical protein
MPGAFNSIPDP